MATAVFLAGMASVAAADSANDLGKAFDPQPVSEAVYGESPPVWGERQFTFLTASDGRRLYMEWWLPAQKPGGPPVPEQVPVVLEIPYTEAPNSDFPGYARYRSKTALVSHGYAVARLHVRGTGASEGCFGYWGPQEADDAARALRWLAAAGWTNGEVGMYGLSGSAIAALQAATQGEPDVVKALAVVAPYASPGEWLSPDGVPWLGNAAASEPGLTAQGVSAGYGPVDLLFGAPPDEVAEDFTRPGSVDPARLPSRADCPGENAPLHDPSGSYSRWVEDRDLRRSIDSLRAPTMFVVGTSDMNTLSMAASAVFDRIPRTTPKAGVIAAAGHFWPDPNQVIPEYSRPTFISEALVAWFDRYLKDLGLPPWPTVQVQATDGQWRTEPDWPSTGGEPAQLVLGAGELGTTDPSGKSSYIEGGFEDATNGPRPGTFASWETGALPDRLHIAGMPILDTWVALNLPDAHLAARLEAFDASERRLPGGTVLGWRSMQHLDPMPNGYFEQREAKLPPTGRLTPVPIPVHLRFMPTDLAVPKGGKLRLTLAGSLVREPGLREGVFNHPSQPSGLPTQVTILHDCTHLSALRFLLPGRKGDLLNVREADEGDAPLASAPQKFGATPVDGGGIARRSVCGSPPVRLSEQQVGAQP